MSAIETTKYPDIRNYIGGAFVEQEAGRYLDVFNPAVGSVISRVPLSAGSDVDRAVVAATKAFPGWSATPI